MDVVAIAIRTVSVLSGFDVVSQSTIIGRCPTGRPRRNTDPQGHLCRWRNDPPSKVPDFMQAGTNFQREKHQLQRISVHVVTTRTPRVTRVTAQKQPSYQPTTSISTSLSTSTPTIHSAAAPLSERLWKPHLSAKLSSWVQLVQSSGRTRIVFHAPAKPASAVPLRDCPPWRSPQPNSTSFKRRPGRREHRRCLATCPLSRHSPSQTCDQCLKPSTREPPTFAVNFAKHDPLSAYTTCLPACPTGRRSNQVETWHQTATREATSSLGTMSTPGGGFLGRSGNGNANMRGLVQFIADLRNARARELEEKRINKELANIRQKFKDGSLSGYHRKKYVCKLLYIYILGWDVDFGHLEAVNLISAQKYSEKQIGYLAMTLFLHEKHELLHLVVNSIRKDLLDNNELFNCLALHAIANVGGREMGEALSLEVHRLLISPYEAPYFILLLHCRLCHSMKLTLVFFFFLKKNPLF